jgi:hypothetical protein
MKNDSGCEGAAAGGCLAFSLRSWKEKNDAASKQPAWFLPTAVCIAWDAHLKV